MWTVEQWKKSSLGPICVNWAVRRELTSSVTRRRSTWSGLRHSPICHDHATTTPALYLWIKSSTNAMSFFSRSGTSNTPPPPGSYNRIPDGSDYTANLPPGPRSSRRPAPPSAQYNSPQNPYNDPPSNLLETTNYTRRVPSRGGRHVLFTKKFVSNDWLAFFW